MRRCAYLRLGLGKLPRFLAQVRHDRSERLFSVRETDEDEKIQWKKIKIRFVQLHLFILHYYIIVQSFRIVITFLYKFFELPNFPPDQNNRKSFISLVSH